MRESTTYQAILEPLCPQLDQVVPFAFGFPFGFSFGPPLRLPFLGAPDAGTLERIGAIADLERLDELLVRLLDVAGWDELFADSSG